MMRKVLVLLIVLAIPFAAARGQGNGYVQVTGTKSCYANGSVNAAFVNLSGGNQLPLLSGSVFPTTGTTNFNSSGQMSFFLADNNLVIPSPSQWTFTACQKSGGQPLCGTTQLTITGTSPQDISSSMAGFPCPPPSGGGGGGSNMGISVGNQLQCDPNPGPAQADCTALVQNACTAQPGATIIFDLPTGATTATYLMAATANATLSGTCTYQFVNGAQITTGHQASSNITTMNRITTVQGTIQGVADTPETISLAGCTSSSTANTTSGGAFVPGTQTFTNCPNTLTTTISNVYLTGLTNVANCYTQCVVLSSSPTGFAISNPASTLVTAGAETGSLVKTDHLVNLWLSAAGVTTSSGSGIITISAPNPFSFTGGTSIIGRPVGLSGVTNVPVGYYIVTGGSSSTITLNCPACATVAPGAETGYLYYTPGGSATVTFATPLAGTTSFSPGIYPPGTRAVSVGETGGLAPIVCSGTGTDSDGPYWINTFLNSSTMGLLDPRMGRPQITTGSCYLPYTLNIQGGILAAIGQQILAPGAAVTFLKSDPIYVGWYGAKGVILSTDDYLPIQEALFWNAGRHVAAPSIQTATYGFDVANVGDYNVGDSLQLYGNAPNLDGLIGSIWSGSTTLLCNGPGPCVIFRPDVANATIANFNLYAEPQVCGGTGALFNQLTVMDKDGVYSGAGSTHINNMGARCFPRNGFILSSFGGFNNIIQGGSPQPDYWQADRLFTVANGGYGIVAVGSDANAGILTGTSNADGNTYGGYWDNSQAGALFTGANGEGNSGSAGAGAASAVTSLSVTGSGLYAMCTIAPLPTGAAWYQRWITIAGTTGSGGMSGADETWYTGGVNPFSCPGVTGGPATTGTVSTAATNDVYTEIQEFATGNHGGRWVITGLANVPNSVNNNGYSESTNGCVTGSGLIVGGTFGEYLYQDGGANNCGVKTYGTGFRGAFLGAAQSNQLNIYSYNGMIVRGISSLSNNASVLWNAPWNGTGTAFAGFMGQQFSSSTDQNFVDWIIGVNSGNIYRLHEQVGGSSDQADVFTVAPSNNGNYTATAAPSTTGTVRMNPGATSVIPTGSCGVAGQNTLFAGGIAHCSGVSGAGWTGLITTGSGVPTGACAIGSLYTNSAATSASTVLYVCYPASVWNPVAIP